MESEANFEGFDPQVREAVEGLIHLGHLTTDVEFCGHTFGLRTLRLGEELAAATAMEKYRGTLKEPHAFAASQVALALTHVDGDEDFCPQAGPDLTAFARARLNYLNTNWYWPVIDYLYLELSRLLEKQVDAIRSIQDLSTRSLRSSSPSVDSFNEQGTSNEETALEPWPSTT
jgi:hypothetical protein